MSEVVKADDLKVKITNRKRVLFPEDNITKGDLVDYYQRVAPLILPYMEGRPVTMHRFPKGIEEEGFYHQEVSDYFPDWIKRLELDKENGKIVHLICNNTATLIYIANLACITPHVWLSRDDKIKSPDMIVFDLDPSDNDFNKVRRAAFYLKELLDELELGSFVKTTGSRGVHIIVPLDRRIIFDQVREFARDTAGILANRYPKELTVEQRKYKRGKRVYIDTLRNSYGQTVVAPYAVRAKPGAPIATPIYWKELENPELNPQSYNMKNIFQRLSQEKDPWKEIWHHPCSLQETSVALYRLKNG